MIQTQLSESYEEIRNQEYERRAHSVGISIWHFEWVTKYRYKMMKKEQYSGLMIGCIRNVAFRHKIKIVIILELMLSYQVDLTKNKSIYTLFLLELYDKNRG